MNKKLKEFYYKDEKGAITLFILLAVLFFIIVLFSIFYNLSNKNMAQNAEIENVKKNYDNSKSLEEIKTIYNDKIEELKSCKFVKLDNQNATNIGTTQIYQFTDVGIYLDINQSKEMTTSSNKIIIPETKYTITYNFNGGEQKDYSVNVSFVFKGYFTEKNGKGMQMISKEGYITSNFTNDYFRNISDPVLYASWDVYSVVLPVANKKDFACTGWYDASVGGNKLGDVGNSYIPSENKTLYAQWIDNVSPTIENIKVTTQTGIYTVNKDIDVRLQFTEEIKGTIPPVVKVKFGNGSEQVLMAKTLGENQSYIDYTITIEQGDIGNLVITDISGGNITDLTGNSAIIKATTNTGNIVTADTIAPLVSIYEDQNTATNKSMVSVDVADYETDVAYVELPDGTRKTIYDEVKDNVKVLILEEITSSPSVSGLKSYEPIIRKCFSNVTVDSSYTAANIGNTDFDVVFSNANVWNSKKEDVLRAAFDAGKNVITIGNDSTNALTIIENTFFVDPPDLIRGRNQLADNEITPKINYNGVEHLDGQHIITQLKDGVETWYTLEYKGKEYPAIAFYEDHGTRWFHSQVAVVSFDEVMPHLVRKLTRITTASYEITKPGTYTFKVYDQAGNCTEKTITTGNYKVTFEYNEENVKNGDFSEGLTSWNPNMSQVTVNLDTDVLNKGKPSARIHIPSNVANWMGIANGTLANTCYRNQLYKISFMAYKDSTSLYGDAITPFFAYCPEYDSATGNRRDTSQIFIDPKTMIDRHWTKVEKEFTTWGNKWTEIYLPFSTSGVGNCTESTIWVSDVRVERIQNQTKTYGNALGTLPVISRPGYVFQGWYTEPKGGTKITESTKVLSGNVTYYAHWAASRNVVSPFKSTIMAVKDKLY